MKAQSAEMQYYRFASGSTAFATCWFLSRTDGQTFGFTSLDRDIHFNGVRYIASSGFTPSSLESNRDLSVMNVDVTGVIDSDLITEKDLQEGRWDFADVTVFEVNYRDLSMGVMILGSGRLGNITSNGTSFVAELRGLTQNLQAQSGKVYTAACTADFCDAKCGLDEADYTYAGSVTQEQFTERERAFTDTGLTQAADYFKGGYITWTSGENAGLQMEVRSFSAGAVVLALPMPNRIRKNDAFTIVAGCAKNPTDCKTKWLINNYVRYRGFPDVPLNDAVMGEAGSV